MGARRRATLVAAAVASLAALSCKDGTGPEASLRLSSDTATVVVGGTRQLVALDAQGPVAWSSDDPGIATVVERTGFVTGIASGTTLVRADDGTSQATAQISVRRPPSLLVAPATAAFEAAPGEAAPAPAVFSVTNDGDLPLTGLGAAVTYAAGQPTGWLSTSFSATTAPANLTVQASQAGLDPGTYSATVAVSSPVALNGSVNLAVTLVVVRPPSIEVDRAAVELGTVPGFDSPPTQVAITNGGDRPLADLAVDVDYTSGAAGGWLDASLDGSTAPATLTLIARGATLAQGAYSARVTVSSTLPGVESRIVDVDLAVAQGPSITLSNGTLAFSAVVGQTPPGPQAVSVTNGGGGVLGQLSLGPVTYSGGAGGWLNAALDATTAPAQVSVSVDSDPLPSGSYTASFEVRSPVADNSPRTISVTLTVAQAPVISISPPSWSIKAARQRNPAFETTIITNTGGGELSDLTATVTAYGGGPSGWLDLTLTRVGASWQLVGRAAAQNTIGLYTATVTLSSNIPGVAPRSFPVTYQVVWAFQYDVQPLFQAEGCVGCHFLGGGQVPPLAPASDAWTALVAGGRVTPGNPNVGVLMCKITGTCSSAIDMTMTPTSVQRIREWIQGGAVY